MIPLRDYQVDLAARAMVIRRPLVVLPTGAGKTVVACDIIHKNPFKHVLVVAHRRELIFQCHGKLAAFDVDAGVILSGEKMRLMRGVQVASVQTLWSHMRRGKESPHADILIVDEAHHVPARTYRSIIANYPEAQIIGLTATPCRRDGRGLGSVFDEIVEGPQVAELIKLGYLVGTKVYAPSMLPDLAGVHTRHGDYVESELAERMDRAELVGDIVTNWLERADRRKTLLFATSVGHSVHLKDELVKAGVRAEHLDGSTPKEERDAILAQLAAGDLEVVCNCMVLTEGYDLPDLGCIVLARPTKSMGAVPADARPRSPPRSRQRPLSCPRPCRRRVSARLRRGPGRMDPRTRSQGAQCGAGSASREILAKSTARVLELPRHPHRR
jgi:superfamily II DNA or RNA helicase